MSNVWLKQFELTRKDIFKDVEELSAEAFDVQPDGLPNTIRWQLGHVLSSAEFFLFGADGQLPATYNEWFGYGSKPSAWQGDVPTVDTLVQQLKDQLERIQNIPAGKLQENLPKPIFGCTSFGELVMFTTYHESTHAGQIHVMSKLV